MGTMKEVQLPSINTEVLRNTIVGALVGEIKDAQGNLVNEIRYNIYAPVGGLITYINTTLVEDPSSLPVDSTNVGKCVLMEIGSEEVPLWAKPAPDGGKS